MIQFEDHELGVILPVRAQPGARFSGLRGGYDGALKVCVTQVAEQGKANDAIVDVLCKLLRLRKSQVKLIAGKLSSRKKFLVQEMDVAELQRRIEAS